MAINKVIYGGKQLIDLTEDSVSPITLLEGITAHNKSGDTIFGTVPHVVLTVDKDGNASFGFTVDTSGDGILRCISFEVDGNREATVT